MEALITKTDLFVSELFDKKLPDTCIYHNYTHTKRVLKSTQEIIENTETDLKSDEKLILQLAALLHDTGFVNGSKDHEIDSAKIAENFLQEIRENNKRCRFITLC